MNSFLKISGTILLIAGFVLAIKPNLFGNFSTPVDAYQMIEKRVKWGLFIGLGVFLLFHRDWASWGLITAGFLTALTFGVILARLTGFVLDGFITKQLWWLLIEFVALMLFGFLYWKQNN
ncbi:hypothetical protein [Sabulibacter ruber]|uniref:hypothetical protein n=1 Tax=Sabulibacter ruber TaxID=2811901 RepID=UPI001A973D4F|nr:hypothetical protein [Sabulibacter ruber]